MAAESGCKASRAERARAAGLGPSYRSDSGPWGPLKTPRLGRGSADAREGRTSVDLSALSAGTQSVCETQCDYHDTSAAGGKLCGAMDTKPRQ